MIRTLYPHVLALRTSTRSPECARTRVRTQVLTQVRTQVLGYARVSTWERSGKHPRYPLTRLLPAGRAWVLPAPLAGPRTPLSRRAKRPRPRGPPSASPRCRHARTHLRQRRRGSGRRRRRRRDPSSPSLMARRPTLSLALPLARTLIPIASLALSPRLASALILSSILNQPRRRAPRRSWRRRRCAERSQPPSTRSCC